MMKMDRLTDDTFVFAFDELDPYITTVTVLVRKKHAFVFDTFLGARYMQQVFSALGNAVFGREVIAINSHAHFDHVFGNAFFQGGTILSSALCIENLHKNGAADKATYAAYAEDDLPPCLPNSAITAARTFREDEITVFPSPGHTADGVSLFDSANGILLVGDNVERPLVQIESADLAAYQSTLKGYLSLGARRIVGGHNEVLTESDVRFTADYIRELRENRTVRFDDPAAEKVHLNNMKFLSERN